MAGLRSCPLCGGIVGIGAEEKIDASVAVGRQVVLEHPADQLVLMPQRDEYSDRLLRDRVESRVSRRLLGSALRKPAGDPPDQACQCHGEIVQTAHQHPDGQGPQTQRDPVIG